MLLISDSLHCHGIGPRVGVKLGLIGQLLDYISFLLAFSLLAYQIGVLFTVQIVWVLFNFLFEF